MHGKLLRSCFAVIVFSGVFGAAFAAAPLVSCVQAKDQPAKETKAKSEEPRQSKTSYDDSLRRGVQWFLTRQNADGGFGPTQNPRLKGTSDVGISAFALYAVAKVPADTRPDSAAVIDKAARFLLSKQQKDGSFHDPRDPSLQNYKTSVAVLALLTLDRKKYADAIGKAVKFTKSMQGANGGIGYGNRDTTPDLSNTVMAAEALYEAGESRNSQTFQRVKNFLTKVQNRTRDRVLIKGDGAPDVWRKYTGDGGFIYRIHDTRGPVETLDDGTRVFSSYGSMTYSGLRTLLYARVGREDSRVKEAFRWIGDNFTIKENPGMATPEDPQNGQQGLFYYYHTMAKALSIYGEAEIKDRRGRSHDWARELGDHLVELQKREGYWINTADRWWESLDVLATSYALVALTICDEEIESRQRKAPSTGEK